MSTIARRLTPQPIKLRADIELTCYTPAGIDAIKKALRAGEKESSDAVPIRAKLVAPPLYVLSTNATDKVNYCSLSHKYSFLKCGLSIVRCRGSSGTCDRIDSKHYRRSGRFPYC